MLSNRAPGIGNRLGGAVFPSTGSGTAGRRFWVAVYPSCVPLVASEQSSSATGSGTAKRSAVYPSTSSGTAVYPSCVPLVASEQSSSATGSVPAKRTAVFPSTSSGTAVGGSGTAKRGAVCPSTGSGTAGDCGVEVLFVYLKWLNSLQGSFFIFTFVAIYLDQNLTRKKDVHNHGK